MIEDDSSGSPGIFAIGSGKTLTVNDSLNIQFNGGVTGSGALTWDATGTLTMSMTTGGASTYSGGTTIDNYDSNLNIESDASLGTGTVTFTAGDEFLTYTADNTATNTFLLGGNEMDVSSGVTLTLDGT